eukprot:356776-Chlamydomonas_euryale.AAC.3
MHWTSVRMGSKPISPMVLFSVGQLVLLGSPGFVSAAGMLGPEASDKLASGVARRAHAVGMRVGTEVVVSQLMLFRSPEIAAGASSTVRDIGAIARMRVIPLGVS